MTSTTEQFSNNSQTTLVSDITISETDLVVTDFAGAWPFPTTDYWRIVVSDPAGTVTPQQPEIMIVTAGSGTETWTVTRGAEGTAATAHAAGSTITAALTAGALANFKANLEDEFSTFSSVSDLALSVLDFGAVGDCKMNTNVHWTGGGTTMTVIAGGSGGDLFASGDAGKAICLQGASSTGDTVWATITTYTDTTHVIVTSASSATFVTAANANAMWGTDDTAAIQSALDALPGDGSSGSLTASGGRLEFPALKYMLRKDGVSTDDVQTLNVTGSPTGGTYKLSFTNFDGTVATASIAYNASASAIQTALQALGNISLGNVTVTGSNPYTVTFTGSLGGYPQQILTLSTNALTGGSSPSVAITHTTIGAEAMALNIRRYGLHLRGCGSGGSQMADPGWTGPKAGGPMLVTMDRCVILGLGQPAQNSGTSYTTGGDGKTFHGNPVVEGLNFVDFSGFRRATGLKVTGMTNGHLYDCDFIKCRVGALFQGIQDTGDASWWTVGKNKWLYNDRSIVIDSINIRIEGGWFGVATGQTGIHCRSGLYIMIDSPKFHVAGYNQWHATTAYTSGDFIRPTFTFQASSYIGRVFKCTSDGTTSGSEPAWTNTVGATYADGTTAWQEVDVMNSDSPMTAILWDNTVYATGHTSSPNFGRGLSNLPAGGLSKIEAPRIEHHSSTMEVTEGVDACYGIDCRYVSSALDISNPMMGGGGTDPLGTGLRVDGSADGTKISSIIGLYGGQINFFNRGILFTAATKGCEVNGTNIPAAVGPSTNNTGGALVAQASSQYHQFSNVKVNAFTDISDSGTGNLVENVQLVTGRQKRRTTTSNPNGVVTGAIGDDMIDVTNHKMYYCEGGSVWKSVTIA